MFVIKDITSAQEALDYFGGFHDGYIKSVKFISDARHDVDEEDLDGDKESVLQSAGLYLHETLSLEMEIGHFNYDWPNVPYDRMISLKFTDVENPNAEFLTNRLLGQPVFSIVIDSFEKDDMVFEVQLSEFRVRANDANNPKYKLFTFKCLEIEEKV